MKKVSWKDGRTSAAKKKNNVQRAAAERKDPGCLRLKEAAFVCRIKKTNTGRQPEDIFQGFGLSIRIQGKKEVSDTL
jgi:hypothetical protein